MAKRHPLQLLIVFCCLALFGGTLSLLKTSSAIEILEFSTAAGYAGPVLAFTGVLAAQAWGLRLLRR